MAYTNVFTNLIKEIYTRLTTAQGTGKKLSDVKKVYIGERVLNDNMIDFPIIMILTQDPFISEDFEAESQKNKAADVNIRLLVLDKLNSDRADNLYYDDSTTPPTGIIPLIERIIDVINETTSQSIDPRLTLRARESVKIEVSSIIKYNENSLGCEIRITARTNDFSINGRYSS